MSEAFRKLHYGPDILILPNAWDAASARIVAAAGFPAIATTSAGIAFARGFPDGERISREEMLSDVACIVGCVDVPVTADLEAGYGPDAEDVAETMRQAIKAGAAGLNLEDSSPRSRPAPVRDGPRRRACRRGTRRGRRGRGAGRHQCPHRRILSSVSRETTPCLPIRSTAPTPTARRGPTAFSFPPSPMPRPSGAWPPRSTDRSISWPAPGRPPLSELSALGVARVSIGSGLARAAYTVARRAAEELLGPGTFTFAEGVISHPEMNALMEPTD